MHKKYTRMVFNAHKNKEGLKNYNFYNLYEIKSRANYI